MKKIICLSTVLCMLLVFVGCKRPASPTTQPSISETESTTGSPQQEPMYAVAVPAESTPVTAEDGTLIFTYTRQHMMLTLPDPDVADKVIMDFLSRIDITRSTADATLAAAKNAYTTGTANWTPYLCSITYSPTRIDQGVLSLSGSNITYSGTSHPERISVSASYDLVTGDVLTLGSIMSAKAEAADFCQLVLDVLEPSKKELYLYEGYEATVRQRFTRDVSRDEDWYFTQTGLCFYFAPYEIAPYSSGVIVAEIPYENLSGLLHDSYFPPERITAGGTVQVTTMEKTDSTSFSQIAEIALDPNAQMVFLHTEGLIWDVEITTGTWNSMSNEFTANYSPLLCHALSPGDAIMVQTQFTDTNPALRLTYSTGSATVVRYLAQKDGTVQLVK